MFRISKISLISFLFAVLVSGRGFTAEPSQALLDIVSTYLQSHTNICVTNTLPDSIRYCHTDGCQNCSVAAGNGEHIFGESKYVPWICTQEGRTPINPVSKLQPRTPPPIIPSNKRLFAIYFADLKTKAHGTFFSLVSFDPTSEDQGLGVSIPSTYDECVMNGIVEQKHRIAQNVLNSIQH